MQQRPRPTTNQALTSEYLRRYCSNNLRFVLPQTLARERPYWGLTDANLDHFVDANKMMDVLDPRPVVS